MPLTELQIKHLKPRDRVYRVTDDNGLTLTITPAGGKLWHVRYRYNGKQQIYSLGKYPLIGLAQARKGRRRNAVAALFVFLKLLKADAKRISDFGL